MWRSVPIERDTTLKASLVGALLLALPAAAQTAPPTDGGAPKPAVTDGGAVSPAATPALESPALGPLGGRDTPPHVRPSEGGTLPGFATSAPGLGVGGFSAVRSRPPALRHPALDRRRRSRHGQSVPDELRPAQRHRHHHSAQHRSSDFHDSPVRLAALHAGVTPLCQSLRSERHRPSWRRQLLAALVPGLFYLDVRGAASVLPATAGLDPRQRSGLAGGNTCKPTRTVTPFWSIASAAPPHRRLGYSFQYARQAGPISNNSDLASWADSTWPKTTPRIAASRCCAAARISAAWRCRRGRRHLVCRRRHI